MKENSFYNKIHRLGRITVVCALISFMAVPFGLAAVNGNFHEYSGNSEKCDPTSPDIQHQRYL